jgi:signal peptidase I
MSLWASAAILSLAACALAIMLARRRFLIATITGTSMMPAIRPGDRVLVRRRRCPPVQAGDILLFRDPDGRQAIKRVAALAGDVTPSLVRPAVGDTKIVPPGMLVFLGDNARSGDSRDWGFIPADQVIGLVIRKLSR